MPIALDNETEDDSEYVDSSDDSGIDGADEPDDTAKPDNEEDMQTDSLDEDSLDDHDLLAEFKINEGGHADILILTK